MRAVKSQLGNLSAEEAWGRRRGRSGPHHSALLHRGHPAHGGMSRTPRPPAYFVSGGEAGPRLVGPAVIVLSVSHLHVVAETDEDLSFSKFFYCGSLAELQGGSAGEMPGSLRASRWGRGEAANASQREGGRDGPRWGARASDSWTWAFFRTPGQTQCYYPCSYLRAHPDRQPGCLHLNDRAEPPYGPRVHLCGCGFSHTVVSGAPDTTLLSHFGFISL